jgi:hypothetical protein
VIGAAWTTGAQSSAKAQSNGTRVFIAVLLTQPSQRGVDRTQGELRLGSKKRALRGRQAARTAK